MSPKRIEYGDHAVRRLVERGITRQDVRWLLARGRRSMAMTLAGEQRWECRGYVGRHEAAVIFLENAERILIVTVHWLDR